MRFVDIRHHPEGAAIAWQLLLERPGHANISHRSMPSIDEHKAYVANHPYRSWYVLESDIIREPLPHRVPVGTILLTMQNEIGIAILRIYQRQGWAARAIAELIDFLPPLPPIPGVRCAQYIANVAPDNLESHRLFEGLGAKIVSTTFQLPERGAVQWPKPRPSPTS